MFPCLLSWKLSRQIASENAMSLDDPNQKFPQLPCCRSFRVPFGFGNLTVPVFGRSRVWFAGGPSFDCQPRRKFARAR
jgi:hypothetical protein